MSNTRPAFVVLDAAQQRAGPSGARTPPLPQKAPAPLLSPAPARPGRRKYGAAAGRNMTEHDIS